MSDYRAVLLIAISLIAFESDSWSFAGDGKPPAVLEDRIHATDAVVKCISLNIADLQ